MTIPTPSRDDNETTTRHRACPVCAALFTPIRRQTYCTNSCRQTAWRRRQASTPPVEVPAFQPRSAHTIYQCPECDTRYLEQQWCHDCARPCRRLDTGGECDCGELLTTNELLGGQPMT